MLELLSFIKKQIFSSRVNIAAIRTLLGLLKAYYRPNLLPGIFKNGDLEIHYPDGKSFFYTYLEIFHREIYKFSKNDFINNIVDVGANIGLSVIYLNILSPKTHIKAFEADPKIYEYLKINLKANNIKNVTIFNTAAWITDAKLKFISDGCDGGTIDDSSNSSLENIEVNAIDFKNFLDDNLCDLLKIDIEGAEGELIPHLNNSLDNIPFIFLEYHSRNGRKELLPELIEILARNRSVYMQSIHCPPTPFISSHTKNFNYQVNIWAKRNA